MTDPMTGASGNGEDLSGAVRVMSATMTGLAAALADQNERLDAQNTALGKLTDSQDRQRWFMRLLAGLYAFDVFLIIGSVATFAILITGMQNNNEQIQEQNRQLQITIAGFDSTRAVVLCPLYRLLVAAESPEGRARYKFGPEAYDAAFVSIRNGYQALRCDT